MVTQRERLIAQGKRQVLLWLSDQVVERLKAICARERCTQQEFIERLIMGYAGPQPGTAADSGGDSIDRLAGSVAGLNAEIAQLGGAVRDYVETSEDRLFDIEARLQHLEATISAGQGECLPTTTTPVETPLKSAPGANEAPGKKSYNSAKKNDLETRRALFIELHHKGLTPTEISRAVKKEGFLTGTGISGIHEYLQSKELTPNRSRG